MNDHLAHAQLDTVPTVLDVVEELDPSFIPRL